MLVIGIVGGVASGKSVVAAALADLGACVIDADAVGHQVLLEPAVIAAAVARWGPEVLEDDGQLSRPQIARRVFGQQQATELAFWESCTHPQIAAHLSMRIQRIREETDRPPAIVLDAAVMFKAGWDRFCDKIVYVDAPREVRQTRALRRGWSAAQFDARERSQVPIEEKRRQADFVVDNSGSLDQTYEQVLCFWQSLSDGQP